MSAAVSEVVTAEVVKADALAPAFAGLEASSARQLREAFVPALLQIEEWERQALDLTVTDETQVAKMQMAGVMRKALKKVRVGVEKKRKELGADALARTKAINCAASIVEALITPLETRLMEQETFGERAAEARKSALQSARADALRAYGADPSVFASLGEQTEEQWAATLDGARLAHEARVAAEKHEASVRAEAERIAAEKREEERKARVKAEAERVERERVQAEENARLKAEAADREAQASAERERTAIELRVAQEATDKAARELAKAQAEAAQVRAEAEKATAERVAADAALAVAEEAARQASVLAPDREKLAAFAATLRALPIPTLTTAEGQVAAKKVASQIAKMAAWVAATGESL